jgi:hypothetical protein
VCRYLEELEAQLTEQNRLQSHIDELESRLRELGASPNGLNRSTLPQQFLTPPETSNTQGQTTTDLSPAVHSIRSQSYSPRYPGYSEDHSFEPVFAASVYPPLSGNGDQEANAEPGVFETGDAGKGWYLGSASGSNIPVHCLEFANDLSDLHEFHQE